MRLVYANNAKTTLAGPISSGATSLIVATGSGALFPALAPNQFFTITMIPASSNIPGEVIYVTARSGDTFSGLLRGQEGTTAAAYSAGDTVSNQMTEGGFATALQLPIFNGNPNGFLAGQAGGANISPDAVYDPVHNVIWVCTTPSTNPSLAVWTEIGASGLSPANPTAVAGPTANNGVATTYMRSDASPAVQIATTGQKGLVQPDGSTITIASGVISASAPTSPGNPTATAGPLAINGTATTYMRSDAAPPVQRGLNSQLGIVQADGVTITSSNGIISATGSFLIKTRITGITSGVITIDPSNDCAVSWEPGAGTYSVNAQLPNLPPQGYVCFLMCGLPGITGQNLQLTALPAAGGNISANSSITISFGEVLALAHFGNNAWRQIAGSVAAP